MIDDLKYWLALSLIKDIGPITIKRLLSAFRSPQKILEAGIKELAGVDDIPLTKAKKIHGFDSWDKVEKEIQSAQERGIRIVKYTDSAYPEPLRQLEDAPVILYMKGDYSKEDTYAIAMVGSRNMSEYGKKISGILSSELAACGFTIISGMARGVDTISHKGALKAGGRTIAVLGCGMDKPYPPENSGLFEQISRSGSVMSEFAFGMPPNRENFPRRNRLISGLSLGVLVVEATINSGSLITAGFALEQGKEVFSVPGHITSRHSEGTNSLIKKGAKLVQKVEDIVEELSPLLKGLLKSSQHSGEDKIFPALPDGLEISNEEKAICNILGMEPKHIDLISREINMPPAKLSGLLLSLEIKGVVKQAEGKRFYVP